MKSRTEDANFQTDVILIFLLSNMLTYTICPFLQLIIDCKTFGICL